MDRASLGFWAQLELELLKLSPDEQAANKLGPYSPKLFMSSCLNSPFCPGPWASAPEPWLVPPLSPSTATQCKQAPTLFFLSSLFVSLFFFFFVFFLCRPPLSLQSESEASATAVTTKALRGKPSSLLHLKCSLPNYSPLHELFFPSLLRCSNSSEGFQSLFKADKTF